MIFLIDTSGIDNLFDSSKEDDIIAEDIKIKIGDINAPIDASASNNNASNSNNLLAIYHQKLELKCKKNEELISATAQKEENNLVIDQKIFKKSILVWLINAAENRDVLLGKIDLKKYARVPLQM